MGASESNCKPEIDPRSWIANNKTVGVADSRHYGDRAKIVLEKATGRKIIVKEKFIDNQAFNDRISEYLRSGALHCGVFTTLRANMVGTQKQYCGTCISARKLVMAFEYHDRNLAKEIAWRSQRNVSRNGHFGEFRYFGFFEKNEEMREKTTLLGPANRTLSIFS